MHGCKIEVSISIYNVMKLKTKFVQLNYINFLYVLIFVSVHNIIDHPYDHRRIFSCNYTWHGGLMH